MVDAIIQNLEIIGEATKNIALTTKRLYPDISWKQMNGMPEALC